MSADVRCACGNKVNANGTVCDWCEAIAGEPPHQIRLSALGTTFWCVTCNSPLCNLI